MKREMEIEMVKCPICRTWTSDTSLVCEECQPALDIDLAVADLEKSVDTLERSTPAKIVTRFGILVSLHGRLNTIIQKVASKKYPPGDQ